MATISPPVPVTAEIQAEMDTFDFKSLDFVHIAPVPPSTEVRKGVCRYVGPTEFSEGVWVGVELVGTSGKNSGSVRDFKYFSCQEGQGVFVRPELVTPFGHNVESVAAAIANVVQQQQQSPRQFPSSPRQPSSSPRQPPKAKLSPVTPTTPVSIPILPTPALAAAASSITSPITSNMNADPKKNLSGHTELELLSQIEELKDQIKGRAAALNDLQEKYDEMEVDLELATEEKLSFEEEVEELRLRLELGDGVGGGGNSGGGGGGDESAALILGLRHKVDTLSAESAALHAEIASLREDLAATTDNSQDAMVEQLTEKKLELTDALEFAQEASERHKSDAAALNEINLMLEEEVIEARKEYDELEAKLADLQERCDTTAGDTAQAKLQEQLRKVGEELRQVRVQLTTKKMTDLSFSSRKARDAHTATMAIQHVSSILAGKRTQSKVSSKSAVPSSSSTKVLGSVAAADVSRIAAAAGDGSSSSRGDESRERSALLNTHATQVSEAATTLLSHINAGIGMLDVCAEADALVGVCADSLLSLSVAVNTLVSARKVNASKALEIQPLPSSKASAANNEGEEGDESTPKVDTDPTPSPPALHTCLFSCDDLFVMDSLVSLMMIFRQVEQLRDLLSSPEHHDRVSQLCSVNMSITTTSGQPQSILVLLRKCTVLLPSICAAATLHTQAGAASEGLSASDAKAMTHTLQELLSRILLAVRPFFSSFHLDNSNSNNNEAGNSGSKKGLWVALSNLKTTSALVPTSPLRISLNTLLYCANEGLDLVSRICAHPLLSELEINYKDGSAELMRVFTETRALLEKASSSIAGAESNVVLASSSMVGSASLFLLCSSITAFSSSLEQADFDFNAGLFPTLAGAFMSRLGKLPSSTSVGKQALLPFFDCGNAFTQRITGGGGASAAGGWDADKSPLMELLSEGLISAFQATKKTKYLGEEDVDANQNNALAGMLLATDDVLDTDSDLRVPDGADAIGHNFSPLLSWMGNLYLHRASSSGGADSSSDDMAHAGIATVANLFIFGSIRRDVNLVMSKPATVVASNANDRKEGDEEQRSLTERVGDQCRERLLRALFLTTTADDPSRTFLFGALSGVAGASGGNGGESGGGASSTAATASAGSASAAAVIALEDERSALSDRVKKLELQLWEGKSEQGVFKQVQKELDVTKKALESTEERHAKEKAKLEEFMEVEMTKLQSSKTALQSELRVLRTEAKLSPLSASERRAQRLILNYYSDLVAGALLGGETGLGAVIPAVTQNASGGGGGKATTTSGGIRASVPVGSDDNVPEVGMVGYSILEEAKRRAHIRNQRLHNAGLKAIRRYCAPFQTVDIPSAKDESVLVPTEVVGSVPPLSSFSTARGILTSSSPGGGSIEHVLLALHRATAAPSSSTTTTIGINSTSTPEEESEYVIVDDEEGAKIADDGVNGSDPNKKKKASLGVGTSLPSVFRFTTSAKCATARTAVLTK